MARCPFARWDPIPASSSQPAIRPWGVVLHTAVSNSPALTPWSNTEWHFYVGAKGEITQFVDTETRADCQLDGNRWVVDGQARGHISIETWDGAGRVWDGKDVSRIPPWTEEQVEAIGRLLAWLSTTHGIPLQPIRAWNGRGIGYHRQFTSSSSPRWNTSHACPGDRRVAQIPSIIDAAKAALEGDMALTDSDIQRIARATVDEWLSRRVELREGEQAKYGISGMSAGRLLLHGGLAALEVIEALVDVTAQLNAPMSDEERVELAADIASRVDRLRVVLEREGDEQ